MLKRRVRMTRNLAEWIITHPEIYEKYGTGEVDSEFDDNMQMAILVLIGGEVTGYTLVRGADSNTYGVNFSSAVGHDFMYCEYPRDIEEVK